MSNSDVVIQSTFHSSLKENSGSIIVTGLLLIVMGLLAMGLPLVAGISLVMLIGVLLIGLPVR
jgi:uncharacterized membrane protein HdeD (DUF308 family)